MIQLRSYNCPPTLTKQAGVERAASSSSSSSSVAGIGWALYCGSGASPDQKHAPALKLDETNEETVKAGGYIYIPGGTQHYAIFPEDTVIERDGTKGN
jgi:hypothetical protein